MLVLLGSSGSDLFAALANPGRTNEGAFEFEVDFQAPLTPPTWWKWSKSFLGDRIEAVLRNSPGAVAKVWLDGVPVAEHPEVRSHALPAGTLLRDVRCVNALVAERWTVTLTEIGPDRAWFKFQVVGSVTGFDGEGRSDREFVSTSGRVVAGSSSWRSLVDGELEPPIQVGHAFSWDVEERFQSTIATGVEGSVVTLASGLRTTEHYVAFEPVSGSGLPVRELRWSSSGEKPQREPLALRQRWGRRPFTAEITSYADPGRQSAEIVFQALPRNFELVSNYPSPQEYGWVISLIESGRIYRGFRIPYFSTREQTNGWTVRLYVPDGIEGSPGTMIYEVAGNRGRGFGVMEDQLPYYAGNTMPRNMCLTVQFPGAEVEPEVFLLPTDYPTVGAHLPSNMSEMPAVWWREGPRRDWILDYSPAPPTPRPALAWKQRNGELFLSGQTYQGYSRLRIEGLSPGHSPVWEPFAVGIAEGDGRFEWVPQMSQDVRLFRLVPSSD